MSANIVGLAQLGRQLLALKASMQGKFLRASVKQGIQPALERARSLIPVGVDAHRTYKGRKVQPGFAKKSIRAVVTVARDKASASAILGVKSEAFYATQFVELGTSKTAARPWLRPAFRGTKQQQESGIAETLKKSIQDAARTR